ncbi:DNA-directed RNA polymerase II subunit 7 isoform X2 [Brassica rapa]|uniref:DNA-directed RNA polymerase II subunit 7 isoform X2 n=1 Tax=Brassica campestris TaxID=3711 RepID=UPI00142E3527|nr:DNA-directed RNA polymerase II subunit 7 isoform X2 [Brassica rapa]XP_048621332.1 DNA-directed RNA polymerase II subunit 7-like isoform X2 [Brassica napus]
MFFHMVLERNMQLHPRFFGRSLRENLVSKLMKDVEGTISGRHGFVLAVTGIESIGKGLIRDGTPFVTFPVKYRCVVFRPFEGEVLEAVVTTVMQEMQDGMEYQAGDIPNYTSSDASVRIQKDCEVLLKITTVSVVATEIFCLGSIKGKYLGLLNDRA